MYLDCPQDLCNGGDVPYHNTQPEFLANLGELCVNLVIISDFCISISYYDELPRGRDEQGWDQS